MSEQENRKDVYKRQVLVLTDWEEFLVLDFARIRSLLRQPMFFDGRNLYDPEQMQSRGFHYFSIGRREVLPLATSETTSGTEEAA